MRAYPRFSFLLRPILWEVFPLEKTKLIRGFWVQEFQKLFLIPLSAYLITEDGIHFGFADDPCLSFTCLTKQLRERGECFLVNQVIRLYILFGPLFNNVLNEGLFGFVRLCSLPFVLHDVFLLFHSCEHGEH